MYRTSTWFRREARQRIAMMFPPSRIPFYQSLEERLAFSAFQKIERILLNEERAWHLFLLALHILFEGWHELPPLSVAKRKILLRNAQSLRAVAKHLRTRRLKFENNTESAALERMADQLEWIVCPSADGIYNLKPSQGIRFDPRDSIPLFELANLFRQRLPKRGFYTVIVDLLNALPGRRRKYNAQTIKIKLARMRETGFLPRVQFIYAADGVVTLKFRNAPMLSPIRIVD